MTDPTPGTSASTPAAGWYPDPSEAGSSRWWTGESWTGYTQPAAAVAAIPAASAAVAAHPVDAGSNVPLTLFADPVFTPAVLAPAAAPQSQSEWHATSGGVAVPKRQTGGRVSLSTGASGPGRRTRDPYQRNWIAGAAIVLAVLSIPALGVRALVDLPPLSHSIVAGAPIAVSLLALGIALRRGAGVVLPIVAAVLSGAVLGAGLIVDPGTLRSGVEAIVGLLPS